MATSAGAGLSTATEAIPAARQAAAEALRRAGVPRADWGVAFATTAHRPHFAAILAEIQKTLGTDSIAGCSAWGVLAGAEEIEGRPGVVVLAVRSDRIAASTLFASLEAERLDEAARQIAGAAGGAGSPGSRAAAGADELLVLLPDPFATRPDHLLAALERVAPDAVAVGAAASADPSLDHTFQFYGRNVATRAVSGVRLGGRLRHAVGITQGCQPLGEPCRVTRGEGNVILELDARPALEVLRSRLPAGLRDSLARLAGHLFVGLPPDPAQARIEPGEYLVRHLVGLDPERGALIVGSTVLEGQLLVPVLREGGAAREDLKDMLRRLGAAMAGATPRFGLYFNCAARGTSLYGLPGIDAAYLSGAFGELPIVGFFGNAEIAPLRGRNRVFTYTGVLALVGEAP
jgi:small ligand-binding sensory domain FIST